MLISYNDSPHLRHLKLPAHVPDTPKGPPHSILGTGEATPTLIKCVLSRLTTYWGLYGYTRSNLLPTPALPDKAVYHKSKTVRMLIKN